MRNISLKDEIFEIFPVMSIRDIGLYDGEWNSLHFDQCTDLADVYDILTSSLFWKAHRQMAEMPWGGGIELSKVKWAGMGWIKGPPIIATLLINNHHEACLTGIIPVK